MTLVTYNTSALEDKVDLLLSDLWVAQANTKFVPTIKRIMNNKTMNVSLDISNLQKRKWNGELRFKVENSEWTMSQMVVHPMLCATKPQSVKINDEYVTFKW